MRKCLQHITDKEKYLQYIKNTYKSIRKKRFKRKVGNTYEQTIYRKRNLESKHGRKDIQPH